MRLEQRIGRVDRIGQPKTVQAINFVIGDSVEFRVREVLEQKLSVIFEEFGIDKTGDVLDSAQAGELFETVFINSILTPEHSTKIITQALNQLTRDIRTVRQYNPIFGLADDPRIYYLKNIQNHPLPYWLEQMVVGFVRSSKGKAEKKHSWWNISWPDGLEQKKCVFSTKDADLLQDATLINLENSRVRDLTLSLPLFALGQSLPCVFIPGLPVTISGLWGLFELRLQAGMHQKTQLLRIPLVRRAFISVFLSGEGKLFQPTARHIWDALQTTEAQVQASLAQDESISAYERLHEAAEQAGQERFDTLQQAHLAAVAREEERGINSFTSRRKAIERVGLPEVRQFRLSHCNAEETKW